ncbi:MAG: anthranilate phosphoribosyltransferase [Planctomycetes bacterium]|nr:anthranilate phosphoribosyltransferase [Planctomycetota bacterium]
MFIEAIEKINSSLDLNVEEASKCLELILENKISESDIMALLEALCNKGEAVDEIVGFAKTLQSKMVKVKLESEAIDLCGTGGSGLSRFNISTFVAFILASSGVKVAKHGNKGSRTNNGSFDLLEELGINLNTTSSQEEELFKELGLCFLFARTHHPAMKAVGPARAKLGRRTIFNLIGPLCNPGSVENQIVGISNQSLGPKMAEVMLKLGKKKALIVYGEPGIDEFSLSGTSTYWLVNEGKVSQGSITPEEIGISPQQYESLPGGDCTENAKIFMSLLNNNPCQGLQNMAAFNAGAAFWLMDQCASIKEGYLLSLELLASGKVKACFEAYRDQQSKIS